jgi:hypothetical protein
MKAVPFDLFATPRARSLPGGGVDNPLSVGDLALQTRDVIESRLRPVWVRGEVTDFKRHRNGHWYFCLRDRAAQIRCVVWAGDQYRVPAQTDDGMQVVVFGQMTVYTARTDLQLKVTRIDAEGDGLWRKAMELTLAKLRREGLLDESRKRALPHFPRVVAVVTSPDSAALRDIASVMRKRMGGARLVLCPTSVQGDGAAGEIAAALRRLARWGKADVVIVGRGGGGKEDLWAFNDERVARAVAAFPVPVISAVGHEADITVCDAVADLRAPTPPPRRRQRVLTRRCTEDYPLLTRPVRCADCEDSVRAPSSYEAARSSAIFDSARRQEKSAPWRVGGATQRTEPARDAGAWLCRGARCEGHGAHVSAPILAGARLRPSTARWPDRGKNRKGGPRQPFVSLFLTFITSLMLGMRHAADPDHIVAVTTIVARERWWSCAAWMVRFWAGHTTRCCSWAGDHRLQGRVPARLDFH